ncbi:hypothetical protein PIB30_038574 [Stylosanthes scabra]|uniref:Uncharacterized protein n=1 Tax=Stylosanthes scabra TaxID=79078 RepID=A0ABU6ZAZ7_9FABA|nr:hypothetical protein [Stylosanthes scabra]
MVLADTNTCIFHSRPAHGSDQIRKSVVKSANPIQKCGFDPIRKGCGSDIIRSANIEDQIADLYETSALHIPQFQSQTLCISFSVSNANNHTTPPTHAQSPSSLTPFKSPKTSSPSHSLRNSACAITHRSSTFSSFPSSSSIHRRFQFFSSRLPSSPQRGIEDCRYFVSAQRQLSPSCLRC